MKAAFLDLAGTLPDFELAETFFNSATRRVFATVGIDPEIEFVSAVTDVGETGEPSRETDRFEPRGSLDELLTAALLHHRPACGFAGLAADVELGARAIRAQIPAADGAALELVKSPFYRGQGAYLVGRLIAPSGTHPLVLVLTHPGDRAVPSAGARLDAVLVTEDEVSIVFSFTRSYFFVDGERPRELVRFLKSIMPRKPVSELYNAIGYNKHGKTELYRALLHHLETTDDRFEIARGERGMVMVVFDAARLRLGLQGHPRPLRVPQDRRRAPRCSPSTAWSSDTTAPAGWSTRRSSSTWTSSAGGSATSCSPSSPPRRGETVRIGDDQVVDRPPLHRAAAASRSTSTCARPRPADARGGGARLRPGAARPRGHQHLPRRHAAQELRRHPPRAGGLLRLRRAVPADRLQLPRPPRARERRGGDRRRALVLRRRAGHLPRGVPALPRPARGPAASASSPPTATCSPPPSGATCRTAHRAGEAVRHPALPGLAPAAARVRPA